MPDFINDKLLKDGPWQALERTVARLMQHGNFSDVRLVGRTGDEGADILGSLNGKRWVVQVKYHSHMSVGIDVVNEVMNAMKLYHADVPVLATNTLFTDEVSKYKQNLLLNGINLQLWDKYALKRQINNLPDESTKLKSPREYQKNPINNIVNSINEETDKSGLVVMATGLGKTFVASEAIRRIKSDNYIGVDKVLILAHTNELVYQLERSFWPTMKKNISSAIWNGVEKGDIVNSEYTFACINSVISWLEKYNELPTEYKLIVIDEAHHSASGFYKKLIEYTKAGKPTGPYLLGLTATPWRMDNQDINQIFENQLCSIDLIQGMGNGYLSNVDYRMHTDNINWDVLVETKDVTPKALNKTLFIEEWNDAVIDVLQKTMSEVTNPRVIVFCSNISHAHTVRDKINSRRFAKAAVIYSGVFNGNRMTPVDRSTTLCDFSDGRVQVICAVDIFNEGIDVPDVNILVFQRVTHSRRIFVQQLGRGLRLSEGKDKVIVLDFVSDIRRFAAGIEMATELNRSPIYIKLGNPVKFMNKSGGDPNAGKFLTAWLSDAAKIQDASDNDPVLKFPPLELLEKT